MTRASALLKERARFNPVVPWPFFWLLMALNFFSKLPLPASVHVPARAINPLAADEACLMRSQHVVPLKQQHAELKEEAEIFESECDAEEYPVLWACFFEKRFDESHYKHRCHAWHVR